MEIKPKKRLSSKKRSLIVTLAILLAVAAGSYLIWPFITFDSKPIKIDEVIKLTQPSSGSAKELSVPRLVIPDIGVSAYMQEVGTDKEGNMGVPDSMQDVGWYKGGAKPGETGNAVVAGHVSSWRGPAVFAKLKDLNLGDEVYVITKDNRLQKFTVVEKQDYAVKDAPLQKIFGPTEKNMLNLITCSGNWSISERSFSKRFVVFTELVEQTDL